MTRCRIAVVSPFIDKRHGTERRVAECIARLSGEYEFHLYSQRVEDVDLGRVVWHRIPALPGPHLFGYLWWFAANHLWRWRDRLRGIVPGVVYSPGINCVDADAVSVHVLFARFLDTMKGEMRLDRNPVRAWPRLLHRRLYYGLIVALERRVYRRRGLAIATVSRRMAENLRRYYQPEGKITVIYNGLDPERFSPLRRCALRGEARASLGLRDEDFAILLIANDWRNKGLSCLLDAVARTADPRLQVLVVGRDDPAPFAAPIARLGLAGRIHFLPPRPDVEFYYAAADAYAGPSFEDAFAQPPAEAMACGLPAVTSRANGTSEIITHGRDGFVLENAADSATLAAIIGRLVREPDLRQWIGEAAAQTARQYTWEQNARQMRDLFEQARGRKRSI